MRTQEDYEFLELFGQRLRQYRKAKGLTQAEVASSLDMPTNNYGKIENGKQGILIENLAKLGKTRQNTGC